MVAIQTLAWLVCGIYATIPLFWLVIHPFAQFWRSRFRAPLKVLVFVWVLLWVITWAASAPWRYATLAASAWWSLAVIPCWAMSIFIYFGGQRHFTLNQVIGRTELESDRQEQVLVTTGLHARMRHPLYFGHLCTMLGWSIGAGTVACFALTAFAVATGAIMIPLEERELRQRFGDEYRRYSEQVPMIIPTRF